MTRWGKMVAVLAAALAITVTTAVPATAGPARPGPWDFLGGSAVAWGDNSYAQLGDGTDQSRFASRPVAGLDRGVKQVSGGRVHSLAVTTDGRVLWWAWSLWGPPSMTPVPLNPLGGIVQAEAGGRHNLALGANGTVWSWGQNTSGQLGDGGQVDRPRTPAQVPGLTGIVQVAAGDTHSLALRNDGTVWAWGENSAGQLGDGTTTDRYLPVRVAGLTGVTRIAGGDRHSLAIIALGEVAAWGSNGSGQLGIGSFTVGSQSPVPVTVTNLWQVVDISGGGGHSMAVKSDGTVWNWGLNVNKQLGAIPHMWAWGLPTRATDPGMRFRRVAAGMYHSLALAADGSVWTWGTVHGDTFQDLPTRRVWEYPVRLPDVHDATDIAAGDVHSLAVWSRPPVNG